MSQNNINEENIKHSGRIGQVGIYLGKLFRMFIFQSDWKALPMAAIIAGLVSIVVGKNLYYTMEGTAIGTFALSCVCIWNGCFNSIQVICRERAIVKREHRAGLHMSSYVAANMIYQAFLCLSQTIITVGVLYLTMTRMERDLPKVGYITGSGLADLFITIFLISYSANIISLFISAVVRNTTTAMTIVPFLLIFQLIFSGGFFELSEKMMPLSNFTVSKWGMTALCAQGDYNGLPMVSMWNALFNMQDFELNDEMQKTIINTMEDEYHMSDALYDNISEKYLDNISSSDNNDFSDIITKKAFSDIIDKSDFSELVTSSIDEAIPNDAKPVKNIVYGIQGLDSNGYKIGENHQEDFMKECAKQNYKPQYESTKKNIITCWMHMFFFIVIFGLLSVISLEFIDRDKR